jgi:hypothetical protein
MYTQGYHFLLKLVVGGVLCSLSCDLGSFSVMSICRDCGATPARSGSIYPGVDGFHCDACCDAELAAAAQGYLDALNADNESESGNIGAVVAWLEAKGKGNGKDKGKDKDNSKGKARSRSPHRFEHKTH